MSGSESPGLRMDGRKLLIGAAAGMIATAPMTLFMIAAFKLLPRREQYPLPPRQVTMGVLEAVHVDQPIDEPAEKSAVTLGAHFLYGAAAGALYSPVAGGTGLPRALEGAALGATVWTVSYAGYLPVIGLMPPPTNTPVRRNVLMFVANVLWGVATALLVSVGGEK